MMEVQRTTHTRRQLWIIRKKKHVKVARHRVLYFKKHVDRFFLKRMEGKPDASNTSTQGSVEPRWSLHRTMEMVDMSK
jgi:hypothetical protein